MVNREDSRTIGIHGITSLINNGVTDGPVSVGGSVQERGVDQRNADNVSGGQHNWEGVTADSMWEALGLKLTAIEQKPELLRKVLLSSDDGVVSRMIPMNEGVRKYLDKHPGTCTMGDDELNALLATDLHGLFRLFKI